MCICVSQIHICPIFIDKRVGKEGMKKRYIMKKMEPWPHSWPPLVCVILYMTIFQYQFNSKLQTFQQTGEMGGQDQRDQLPHHLSLVNGYLPIIG